MVGPDVALSGEGLRRFPTFGNSLIDAITSRLQTDGFEIITAYRGQNAVRIALRANLEVSRSQFIIINGRPMESNSALVSMRLLAPDGALVDAFEVSGDPGDAETPTKVAANVAEHMKGSARLVALAKEAARAALPQSSALPPPSPPANPVPGLSGTQTAPTQNPSTSASAGSAPVTMNDARQRELPPAVDVQHAIHSADPRVAQEDKAGAQAAAKSERLVANDVSRAHSAGSVLGFEMGKEVTLQPCQDGSNEDALLVAQKMTEVMGIPANRRPSNPNITVTTACSLGTNDPGINGFLDSFDLNKINKGDQGGVTTLFVRLPTSDRPSWMTGALSNASFALVLVDQIAIGALIKGLHTGNSEEIIEAVTDKYPKAKHSTQAETCANNCGASRNVKAHLWTMNGLTVMYDPIGTGRCSVTSDDVSGTLMFKTDTWIKVEKRQQVKQKASGAKL